MKVLLDEMIPTKFRQHVPGHDVFSAEYMGWKNESNGNLFRLMSGDGFDVLLTVDKGIEYEQNAATVVLPVVVLHLPGLSMAELRRLVPLLLQTLARPLTPGFHHVPANRQPLAP